MDPQILDDVNTGNDFSMFALLLGADFVVQVVLIILIMASIWSWAVITDKFFLIRGVNKKIEAFEQAFWDNPTDYHKGYSDEAESDIGARLVTTITREWTKANETGLTEHAVLIDRAERSLRTLVDRDVSQAGKGIGILASIGSTSPFIGLFGTVWGIMNAFTNISMRDDISLAAIGGPIAEALFATGLGLVAAIPAVIFYNKFSGDLNRYADRLDMFSQDLLVHLSRRASAGGT